MDYPTEYEKKNSENEKKRVEYLNAGDARNYFLFCNKLGINEIEDVLLYEHGHAELISQYNKNMNKSGLESAINKTNEFLGKQKKPRKQIESHVSNSTYNSFLKEAVDYIETNIDSYAEAKKEILIKHFPARFDKKGNQAINEKGDLKVGAIFRNVYNSVYSRLHNNK